MHIVAKEFDRVFSTIAVQEPKESKLQTVESEYMQSIEETKEQSRPEKQKAESSAFFDYYRKQNSGRMLQHKANRIINFDQ